MVWFCDTHKQHSIDDICLACNKEQKESENLRKLGEHFLEEAQKADAWYKEKGMKVAKTPALQPGPALQILKYWEWLNKS